MAIDAQTEEHFTGFSVRQGGLGSVPLTPDTPYGMYGRFGVSGGRATEAEEPVLIGLPKAPARLTSHVAI